MENENLDFMFGSAELKEHNNGIKTYEYTPKFKSIDVFNSAIESTLDTIDKSYKMDMDNLLSMYYLTHTSMKLYRKLLEKIIENTSKENIENAKFILENTHD